MIDSNSFSKKVLLSFLIFFPLVIICSNSLLNSKYPHLLPVQFFFKEKTNDHFSIDSSASTPEDIKKKHYFSGHYLDTQQVGVRVLQEDQVFSSLFPGYPQAMRTDIPFWDLYFTRKQTSRSFLEILPLKNSDHILVGYSLAGCMDIFKKYGADIIIFGNSEVYKGFIPDLFSKLLTKYGFDPNTKILLCTRGGMPASGIEETAKLMKESGQHAQLILWGYSFWSAFTKGKTIQAAEESIQKELILYKEHSSKSQSLLQWMDGSHDFGFSSFFKKINWDSLLPITFQSIRKSLNPGDGLLDEKTATDEILITQHIKNMDRNFSQLLGITPEDCQLSLAQKKFKTTLNSLSALADKVFVYLVPGTAPLTESAPACFLQNVKNMLLSENTNSNVFIKIDDLEKYSLLNIDYVHATDYHSNFVFDMDHTNYNGAKKITERLASWIKTPSKKIKNKP